MAKIKGTRLKLLQLLSEHDDCHAGQLLRLAPELETKGIHRQLKLMEDNGWLSSRVQQIKGERHRPRRFYRLTTLGKSAHDFALLQKAIDEEDSNSSPNALPDSAAVVVPEASDSSASPSIKQAVSVRLPSEQPPRKTGFARYAEDLAVIYEWANLSPEHMARSRILSSRSARTKQLKDEFPEDIPEKYHSKILGRTVDFPKDRLSADAMLGTATPILQVYYTLLILQNSRLLSPKAHSKFQHEHLSKIYKYGVREHFRFHHPIFEARSSTNLKSKFQINVRQRQLLLKAAFEMRCLPSYKLSLTELSAIVEHLVHSSEWSQSLASVAKEFYSLKLSRLDEFVVEFTFHALHFDYQMVFGEDAPSELDEYLVDKPKSFSTPSHKTKRTH